jgi:hypothetical protein
MHLLCTGTISMSGSQLWVASRSVTVNQLLGPGTVRTSFSGDGSYQAAQSSKSMLIFTYLGSSALVIGDQCASSSAT